MTSAVTPEAVGSPSRCTYAVAESPPGAFGPSADCAASAAFLELGERLGILDQLVPGEDIGATDIAAGTGLPESRVGAYLEALAAAAPLRHPAQA